LPISEEKSFYLSCERKFLLFYDLILMQFLGRISGVAGARGSENSAVMASFIKAAAPRWRKRTLKCKSSLLQVRLQFILEAISSNSV
jgi:hypothetical protein